MVTKSDVIVYEARSIRQREPWTSATQAIRSAQWRLTAPQRVDRDEWEQDGYALRVTVTPDDEPFDSDIAPAFLAYATAETVRNPRADHDTRRMGSDMPYAETPYNPKSDRVAWYRKSGASRSVALELAERDMREELDRWTWDYGPTPYVVTVTVTRAGIKLGSASLFGCDLGDDYGDAARYVAEISDDLADEALEQARTALAALCSA